MSSTIQHPDGRMVLVVWFETFHIVSPMFSLLDALGRSADALLGCTLFASLGTCLGVSSHSDWESCQLLILMVSDLRPMESGLHPRL